MGNTPSIPAASDGPPKDPDLHFLKAIGAAIIDRPLDFYPRVVLPGHVKSFNSRDVVVEALGASADWSKLDATKLDDAIDLARESLTEVSKQTEYQDQKATRLLTIATVLSAFAGILFTRFQDSYPLRSTPWDWKYAWIFLAYLAFVLFVLATSFAALLIFHATRSRFKYPKPSHSGTGDSAPQSLLFYTGMIQARPRAWMNDWVDASTAGAPVLRSDLKQRYFRNLVSEAYLVAAKTADKLRFLNPAQNLLAWSLKLLILWLALYVVTVVSTDPTKPPPEPMPVKLSGPVALSGPTVADSPTTAPPLSSAHA